MVDHTEFDVIVVGSGMSGGWAAKEFCEKGMKTLVLERGKDTQAGVDYIGENMQPWDLAFRDQINPKLRKSEYPIQETCYAFRETTKQFFVNDKDHPYSVQEGSKFAWIRGDQVGGKSLMWARQSYRWGEQDFEANKKDGHGADWPIRYKDLEPWYDYVERFIGISGSYENLPQLPDSQFQPPMEMTAVELETKAKVEATWDDRKVIIGRVAHLTAPTEEQRALGRGNCQFRNECERGCSFGAYFSSVSATLPAARRTGNMTLITDTMVARINYEPETGRATGVDTVNRKTGERKTYTARVIFMCASTIGTLQVLLNSTSATFQNGFANSSGVLGQYIMDHHHRVGAIGNMSGFEDRYMIGRRPNGIYVPRYANIKNETDNEFLRGYAYQGGADRPSWQRALGGSGFGAQLKESLRSPGQWYMRLQCFGEMLPAASNRVTLHPNKVDGFGVPQVHLDVKLGPNEWKMRKHMRDDAVAMLEAAGAQDIESFDHPPVPGHCIHEVGGARMGRDPKTSILNKYNQCHDVQNVFVSDGAAFASVACQNPSLTFMALTARAADYAVTQMKAGKI